MKSVNPWFSFIGLFIFLIGVYGALHTAINLTLPKYPQFGVLFINTSGFAPSMQRESDCTFSQVYYSEDGITPREANAGERRQATFDRDRCLTSVAATRDDVRMQDISVSIFFLFLGGGLLLASHFLIKK